MEWGVPDSLISAVGRGESRAKYMRKQGLSNAEMRRADVLIYYLLALEVIPSTDINDLFDLLTKEPSVYHFSAGKGYFIHTCWRNCCFPT